MRSASWTIPARRAQSFCLRGAVRVIAVMESPVAERRDCEVLLREIRQDWLRAQIAPAPRG